MHSLTPGLARRQFLLTCTCPIASQNPSNYRGKLWQPGGIEKMDKMDYFMSFARNVLAFCSLGEWDEYTIIRMGCNSDSRITNVTNCTSNYSSIELLISTIGVL
jgi:hypothetical protein